MNRASTTRRLNTTPTAVGTLIVSVVVQLVIAGLGRRRDNAQLRAERTADAFAKFARGIVSTQASVGIRENKPVPDYATRAHELYTQAQTDLVEARTIITTFGSPAAVRIMLDGHVNGGFIANDPRTPDYLRQLAVQIRADTGAEPLDVNGDALADFLVRPDPEQPVVA